jgi:3-hydroxybutyrate dehydrogenase
MLLEGRTALITGAGSGIGRSIAETFANEGARVLVHDIDDRARDVAEALEGPFLLADLGDPLAVRRLADEALAHGPVDILINNAGFQHIAPVEDFPEEMWTRMLQVMLTAPFQLTKYLLPTMKQRGWGRIVSIASIHGTVASPYKSAYVSAKHGLLGLTKTVALEAAAHGVTVNALCPAYVRTPLVENQIADQARTRDIPPSEVLERILLEPAAIKRLVEPTEVAHLAAFLASDRASAITGSSYSIDLGWTAR